MLTSSLLRSLSASRSCIATTDGCSGGGTGTTGVSLRLAERAGATGLRAVAARLGLHADNLDNLSAGGVSSGEAMDGLQDRMRSGRGEVCDWAGEEEDPKRDEI